jgi:elongator complex protein 1
MAGNLERALDCFVLALQWKEAAAIISLLGTDKDAHASTMINGLVAVRKYSDAAQLSLTFLNRPDMAIDLYTKGQHWNDSIMLAKLHNRADLIETTIRPALLAHAHSFVDEILELKDKLEKQVEKLRKFRIEKAKALGNFAFNMQNHQQSCQELMSKCSPIPRPWPQRG